MQERLTTSGIWIVDDKVLIGKRIEGGAVGGLWEFPGGKNRWGETPQQSLMREFQEELGINITVGKQIYSYDFENKDTLYHLLVFLVDADPKSRIIQQYHSEFRWVSPEDLDKYPLVPSDQACLDAIKRVLSKTTS